MICLIENIQNLFPPNYQYSLKCLLLALFYSCISLIKLLLLSSTSAMLTLPAEGCVILDELTPVCLMEAPPGDLRLLLRRL